MENKKLAAAISAVYTYIRTYEEAAAAVSCELAPAPKEVPAPVAMTNIWGITGRTAMMNANTMMQMRMFK